MGKRFQLNVVWRCLWGWLVSLAIGIPLMMGVTSLCRWFLFNVRLSDWLVIPVAFISAATSFYLLYVMGRSK